MTGNFESREGLSAALHEVMSRGPDSELGENEFEALSLGIFRYQYRTNAVLRAYCDRREATPLTIESWLDIPAIPTDAFKSAILLSGEPRDAVAIFRTSGTTGGTDRRGAHYFRDLSLYNHALRAGFRRHLIPDGERMTILSLIPDQKAAPDSSLSHMIGEVIQDFGDDASQVFASEDELNLKAAAGALFRAAETGAPVALLSTSLALASLLDYLRDESRSVELPNGSRVMDTGGFKGRSTSITREALYAGVEEMLGIPTAWCVNEYGMTEMSSQLYDAVAGSGEPLDRRLYAAPAWVRTVACNPETLQPLSAGELGVLRHWDLANLDSIMTLQTADLGRVTSAGIQLLGRAEGAQARGCSLATEELLAMNRAREAGDHHLHQRQPG